MVAKATNRGLQMDIKYLVERNYSAISFLRAVLEEQQEKAYEDWLYISESYTYDDKCDEWSEAVEESNRVFGQDETNDALRELDRL